VERRDAQAAFRSGRSLHGSAMLLHPTQSGINVVDIDEREDAAALGCGLPDDEVSRSHGQSRQRTPARRCRAAEHRFIKIRPARRITQGGMQIRDAARPKHTGRLIGGHGPHYQRSSRYSATALGPLTPKLLSRRQGSHETAAAAPVGHGLRAAVDERPGPAADVTARSPVLQPVNVLLPSLPPAGGRRSAAGW
jgi:hypothetical protein